MTQVDGIARMSSSTKMKEGRVEPKKGEKWIAEGWESS
jgi:hypothetical protein